jgi:hypothetical protein
MSPGQLIVRSKTKASSFAEPCTIALSFSTTIAKFFTFAFSQP